jgi:hypothetical protein
VDGAVLMNSSVTVIETVFISRVSWQKSVDDAIERNEAA